MSTVAGLRQMLEWSLVQEEASWRWRLVASPDSDRGRIRRMPEKNIVWSRTTGDAATSVSECRNMQRAERLHKMFPDACKKLQALNVCTRPSLMHVETCKRWKTFRSNLWRTYSIEEAGNKGERSSLQAGEQTRTKLKPKNHQSTKPKIYQN